LCFRSQETTKYQNEFARVQEEKKYLHDELLLFQQKLREFEVNGTSLLKDNENLKEEVNSFYQRVSELQGNCRNMEEENILLQRDLSLSKQRNEKVEGELQEFKKKSSLLSYELDEKNAIYSRVANEFVIVKSTVEEQNSALQVSFNFREPLGRILMVRALSLTAELSLLL
jgi:chromosome segregation ATPase